MNKKLIKKLEKTKLKAVDFGVVSTDILQIKNGRVPRVLLASKFAKGFDCEIEDLFRVNGLKKGEDTGEVKTLAELMEYHSITQSKLGKKIGVSQPAIFKMVKGSSPSIDHALKVASFFGCRVKNIFKVVE